MNIEDKIITEELSLEDGGGFFSFYKDYPTIMGDGNTEREAILNVKEAMKEVIKVESEGKSIST